MSRTLAREDAFKLAFEMEMTGICAEDALNYLYETAENTNEMWAQNSVTASSKKYLDTVINGIEENKEVLDNIISPMLKNWTLSRISKVNLAVLRLAFFEINYIDEIPFKVTANEAVKLAKKYGGNESGAFVNGVIGTFLKNKNTEGN